MLGVVFTVVLMIVVIALTLAVGIVLAPKRHIDFYSDESRTDLLLKVLQDKKFHVIVATYTVLTPAGELAGPDEEELSVQYLSQEVGRIRRGGEKIAVAR